MSALYYEGHALIRPDPAQPADSQVRKDAMDMLMNDGWWWSKLEAEFGPDDQEGPGDLILTTREETEAALLEKIRQASVVVSGHGWRLFRYKVEVATVDSKLHDVLGIIG